MVLFGSWRWSGLRLSTVFGSQRHGFDACVAPLVVFVVSFGLHNNCMSDDMQLKHSFVFFRPFFFCFSSSVSSLVCLAHLSPTESSDNFTSGGLKDNENLEEEERKTVGLVFQEDDSSGGRAQERRGKEYNVWYRPQEVPPDVRRRRGETRGRFFIKQTHTVLLRTDRQLLLSVDTLGHAPLVP